MSLLATRQEGLRQAAAWGIVQLYGQVCSTGLVSSLAAPCRSADPGLSREPPATPLPDQRAAAARNPERPTRDRSATALRSRAHGPVRRRPGNDPTGPRQPEGGRIDLGQSGAPARRPRNSPCPAVHRATQLLHVG